MNREIIRNIIVENQQLIQNTELVERHFEFEEKGCYVFVGVRQAGRLNVTTSTIQSFVQYLRDSCLLFSIENYADKFVEKQTIKKNYFVDNGILNLFLTDPDTALLENICAIHLYKNFKERLYYYHKNIEVDFFIPDEAIGIQVSYKMEDENTRNREIKALITLNSYMPLNRALIITRDSEEIIKDGDLTIEVIPVWKWILE